MEETGVMFYENARMADAVAQRGGSQQSARTQDGALICGPGRGIYRVDLEYKSLHELDE